jgi:hypothetical protein
MKNIKTTLRQALKPLGTLCLLLASALPGTPASAADAYPSKPISIVVAYAPGGQGDTFARIVGERLGEVYNRPCWSTTSPAFPAPSARVSQPKPRTMATPCFSVKPAR